MTEVDITNARPTLADYWANVDPQTIDMRVNDVVKSWANRGFEVEMHHEEDPTPPKFVSKMDNIAINQLPFGPKAEDAELLLTIEVYLYRYLAVRGLLLRTDRGGTTSEGSSGGRANGQPQSSSSGGASSVQGTPGSRGPNAAISGQPGIVAVSIPPGTAVRNGQLVTTTGGILPLDVNALPKFISLSVAGVAEVRSNPTTTPPFSTCPTCRGELTFQVWDTPLVMADSTGEAREVHCMYRCAACGRDDLYGEPCTVEGLKNGHPSKLYYPHICTVFPDASYRPDKLRSASFKKVIARIEADELEIVVEPEEKQVFVTYQCGHKLAVSANYAPSPEDIGYCSKECRDAAEQGSN